MFPDIFGTGGGIDTPSQLMHLDPPMSGRNGLISSLTTDSTRFDFDQAVAEHFASPRNGEHVKGSLPFRWSAGSTTSVNSGIFNFPELPYSRTTSLDCIADGAATQQRHVEQVNIHAKKFKKAHRNSTPSSADKRDSLGVAEMGLGSLLQSMDEGDEATSGGGRLSNAAMLSPSMFEVGRGASIDTSPQDVDLPAPPSRKASKTAHVEDAASSSSSAAEKKSKRKASLDPLELDSERGVSAVDVHSFPLDTPRSLSILEALQCKRVNTKVEIE
jgi:hypothetical protein